MGAVKSRISDHLAKPGDGFVGWFVKWNLISTNRVVVKNAVRLCNIQPHYIVLEIGFGPGIGLDEAYNLVKDGPGVIHGVEISETMIRTATERLQTQITDGKVQLQLGSVTKLPYTTHTFDCVFHTNCYYFWDDMIMSVEEIKRVIKPGSLLVTALDLKTVNNSVEKGFNVHANTDTSRYMDSLESVGFTNVHLDELIDDINGEEYQAIFATSPV